MGHSKFSHLEPTITKLYQSGLGCTTIAKQLGISTKTVLQRLSANNITLLTLEQRYRTTIHCHTCNVEMGCTKGQSLKRKYCSKKCAGKINSLKEKNPQFKHGRYITEWKKCTVCHRDFFNERIYKFCSQQCYGVYKSDITKGENNISKREDVRIKKSYKYAHVLSPPKYQKSFFEKYIKPCFLDAKLEEPLHGYIADIYIPSLNLDVECDGAWCHKKERDKKRDSILASKGVKTLRLDYYFVVKNPVEALWRIQSYGCD